MPASLLFSYIILEIWDYSVEKKKLGVKTRKEETKLTLFTMI